MKYNTVNTGYAVIQANTFHDGMHSLLNPTIYFCLKLGEALKLLLICGHPQNMFLQHNYIKVVYFAS